MLPRLSSFCFWKVSKASLIILGEHLGRTAYVQYKDASVPDTLQNNQKLWEIAK